MFPNTRLRRLRLSAPLRELTAETRLSVKNFIMPLFVHEGKRAKVPVASMPGIFRFSLSAAAREAKDIHGLGIPAVLLFGIPGSKDERGSAAFDENGVIQNAARAIKKAAPGLTVIADTCLCEYTSHGHCGPLRRGIVDNDAALALLKETALSQARAGADVIAPSGMMDGMVGAIRRALDEGGFDEVPILSYAVKYASAFYGPFRDAAGSGGHFRGDRKNHQMDPRNAREALREAQLDLQEGADILMVKPAMAYLDVLSLLRRKFSVPLAAYQVSGEYAMLKKAVAEGLLDGSAIGESLTAIRRAGADMIISYFAKEMAENRVGDPGKT